MDSALKRIRIYLAVSLVLNAVLLATLPYSSLPLAVIKIAAPRSVVSRQDVRERMVAELERLPIRQREARLSPEELARLMYSSGIDPYAVRMTVATAISEWYNERGLRAAGAGESFMRVIGEMAEAEMHRLHPSLKEKRTTNEEERRLLKYGELPRDLISQIEAVEAGYRESSDQEFQRALGTILTGDQLNEYLLYNSSTARTLQGRLAKIDIGHDEYVRLYAIEEMRMNRAPAAPYTTGELQAFSSTLGPKRFLEVAGEFDQVASSTDLYWKSLQLGDEDRARLYLKVHEQLEILRSDHAKMKEVPEDRRKSSFAEIASSVRLTEEQLHGLGKTELGLLLLEGRNRFGAGATVRFRPRQ